MNKLRIALLVNAFWNAGAGISGGDQRLIQIFKRIGGDFEVDIYTSADGKKVLKNEIKSANFFLSPPKFEKGNIFIRYLRRANWLTKKLSEKKYDIIYSSSDFFPDVMPAYYAIRLSLRGTAKQFVCHCEAPRSNLNDCHEPKDIGSRNDMKQSSLKTKWVACIFHIYPNWRKRPGNKIVNLIGSVIQNWSIARIKKSADKIININYQVRDTLIEKYKIDKEKIVVNPCGIDLEYFKNIKATKVKNQVCFLARLVPSKGIFDLPEIWQKVIENPPIGGPIAKLKIIGGGSDEVKLKLKNKFNQFGLSDSVEILGFLPNDKAYKILKSSELFIFPSYEEGFGIAIAEAFACGVPAVAWDLPVYREVFPKGLKTVKIGEKNLFASEVVRILKNKKKLRQLATEANNVVQRYDWESIAGYELEIIKTLPIYK